MGATNCPETPRQKMIQMMYLVYTAMLALNVSAEILNAFVVVDDTLVTSTNIAANQNANDYQWFVGQKTILGAKVDEAYGKAQILKKESDAMVKFIEKMRNDLIFAVDGDSIAEVKTDDGKTEKRLKTVATIVKKDNFDIPTDFMIRQGNAKKLKDEINKYKASILKLAKKEDQQRLEKGMALDVNAEYWKDSHKESWEDHNFNHIIAAASVTLLNKMVGEVKNAESMMLNYLKSSISADDFKFDNVNGRSIPKSQAVFSGDAYEADIIVAAYDSKSTPEVWYKMGVDTLTEAGLSGATKIEGENGIVKLKIGTGSTGEQRYAGLIKIMDPNGQPKYYGFRDKYTVMSPSATIAADKMNVLYAGIANPVSVSGPVAADKLSISFPGCNVTSQGAGKYNVSVPTSLIGKTVQASVAAKVGESSKTLGNTTFRVKRVPDPRAVLGANIRGGKRAKAELLANPVIRATMGEDFAYDLKWNVTSFRVILVSKGMEEPAIVCQGGALSDKARTAIQKASANTVVYFSDIKASSEAGPRTLDEFSVRIR
ncbi:MAG: gliding motility protein GldM [Bacteroidales bacterium]|nr:gliding motility protein GldM [Bacteroidales bacterium]MDY6347897.1 gliding motility protein GldM [Bacteroidales bacterium]